EARAVLGSERGDLATPEGDPTTGRREAAQRVDEGRLAGPVGSDQPEQARFGHLQVHAVEGAHRTVGDLEALGAQQRGHLRLPAATAASPAGLGRSTPGDPAGPLPGTSAVALAATAPAMPSGYRIAVTTRPAPPSSSVDPPGTPRSSSPRVNARPPDTSRPPTTAPDTLVMPPRYAKANRTRDCS